MTIETTVTSPINSTSERTRDEGILVDSKRSSSGRWLTIAAISLATLTAVASYRATRQQAVAALSSLSDIGDSEKGGQIPFGRSNLRASSLRAGSLQPGAAPFFPLAEADPISWWHGVRQNDWVGQTMPAVRSVGEGVAPLGRSLMRAVTILTTGGPDQTS